MVVEFQRCSLIQAPFPIKVQPYRKYEPVLAIVAFYRALSIITAQRSITNLYLSMPTDDYTSAAGGGLRLKGVAGAKIAKHKKKRPKHPEPEKRSSSANPDAEPYEQRQSGEEQARSLTKNPNDQTEDEVLKREESEDRSQARGKTEAELRHEERRRRRVCPLFTYSPCSFLRHEEGLICGFSCLSSKNA